MNREPHPEGTFTASLLEFFEIRNASTPPFCFLRGKVITAHGEIFGHILCTWTSGFLLQACETRIKEIPLAVKVTHKVIAEKIYISAEIMYHEHRT